MTAVFIADHHPTVLSSETLSQEAAQTI